MEVNQTKKDSAPVSRGTCASFLVCGALLLLVAALVVSSCKQGPGTSNVLPEPMPTPTTPTSAKAKPAFPTALAAIADSSPVNGRVATPRSVATDDDHGDSRSTATGVAAGSSTAGTLALGDVDVFVITLSESGTLTAYTTGGTDTIGLILDERFWFDFDDDSGEGYNFWLSSSVNAGTYYIAVAGYDESVSGNYTFLVNFREGDTPSLDDDHGDSRLRATKVTAGSATSGTLTSSDVDYFAIKIRQPGTLRATTTGDTDTVGVLHDSHHALDSDDDGGSDYNFALEALVSAGTHYVEVKGYADATTGEYTLHVSFSPQGSPLPLAPTAPSPADEATDVKLDADLSWTPGGGLSTSYDVYFGADPALGADELRTTQAATTYDPGRLAPGRVYYWRVDAKNDTGTTAGPVWSFTTVDAADRRPQFGTATVGDRTYPVEEQMTPFVLPEASGGNPPLSYRLAPAVPGLSFDGVKRTLSGTPTKAGSYGMRYTARDADGDEAELTFRITVTAAAQVPELSFGTATVSDRTYPVEERITPLVLPEASGGNPPLSYRLAPAVPGLSFDAARRTLSGVPSTAGSYGMTYTVRDADGDEAELRFTITVTEPGEQKPMEISPATALTNGMAFRGGTVEEGRPPAATANPGDPELAGAPSTPTTILPGQSASMSVDVHNIPANTSFKVNIRFDDANQYISIPIDSSVVGSSFSGASAIPSPPQVNSVGAMSLNLPFSISDSVCANIGNILQEIECFESVSIGDTRVSAEQARSLILDCRSPDCAVPISWSPPPWIRGTWQGETGTLTTTSAGQEFTFTIDTDIAKDIAFVFTANSWAYMVRRQTIVSTFDCLGEAVSNVQSTGSSYSFDWLTELFLSALLESGIDFHYSYWSFSRLDGASMRWEFCWAVSSELGQVEACQRVQFRRRGGD